MTPTKESFLKDVATHRLEVLLDSGTHRHLRFRRPGTYCMGFDIVTWPGHLAISGDMGGYVFSRLEDMFQFFRPSRPDEGPSINTGYWGEKCVAAGKSGFGYGIKEFSPEAFKAAVVDRFRSYTRDNGIIPGLKDELRSVLSAADDNEHDAIIAARDFYFLGDDGQHHDVLSEFWEVNVQRYTHHYRWCCYAISWAIIQYDAHKDATARVAA